jgi:hypothetical protein
LFSDIVGYTALMAESEARGLRVRERHRDLLRPLAARYHGQVMDETGDELLLVFPSDLDAVNCALAVQADLTDLPTHTLDPIHSFPICTSGREPGERQKAPSAGPTGSSEFSCSSSSAMSTMSSSLPWYGSTVESAKLVSSYTIAYR